MNRKNLYWACQLAGWLGMAAIETINYTFFIAGTFSIRLLCFFIFYAVAGIGLTHGLRLQLRKKAFFERPLARIWTAAALATVSISTLLALLNMVPSIIGHPGEFLRQLRFIDIAALIINWMRYVVVWVILYFMYKILQQNHRISEEKLNYEHLANTTELELLKVQLNPHFLFNALNSVKALVAIDPQRSRQAIVALSDLLRFTLNNGRARLIPLADELREVRKYLELEGLRFGGRLSISVDGDEQAAAEWIPPAVILTMAENAVKHGVSKELGPCEISVRASVSDDRVCVRVLNTGVYAPDSSNGIGLKHIVKRLQDIYPGQFSFTIVQERGSVLAVVQTPRICP